MKKIIIIGDTNDADYVTRISDITDEDLELIKPLITAIKNFPTRNYNWNTSEYCDEQDPYSYYRDTLGIDEIIVDTFSDMVPSCGIHTISEILLYDISKETDLLA